MAKIISFIFIAINLCHISSAATPVISNVIKEESLVEKLSKISQIKSISNEICLKQKEKSKTNKTPKIKSNKTMKIKSDVFVRGNVSCGNLLTNYLNITNTSNFDKKTTTSLLITNKITSQTTIVNEITSKSVK